MPKLTPPYSTKLEQELRPILNHLYDLAIKFTPRDQRDRAGREYLALYAMHQDGLDFTLQPFLLDHDTYAQPVIMYSCFEGQVKTNPPKDNAD